jgi:CBS domain-containing protein
MLATTKTLPELTASDLMTPAVVTLPRHLSLSVAANLLAHAHITGAPVIDENGTCIGVISGSDFIRWARNHRQADLEPANSLEVCADWQMIDQEVEESELQVVGRYMTADPITAGMDTTIQELARMMLEDHIHRVVIVDGHDRPIGIVSSTDLLAALATYPLQ